MQMSRLLSFALFVTGLNTISANAATITYNDDFIANNFVADYGNVPYAVVTGNLSVTLDNTRNYTDSTDISASVDIAFDDGPVKFIYYQANDILYLSGTRLNLGIGVQNDTNNFFLTIRNFSSLTPTAELIYATTNPTYDSVYRSDSVILTPATVPEPVSLALLGTGVLGLAITWRRGTS